MNCYEDIVLGVEFEIGRHTPSKEEIITFARQWDPQPFHLDEEAGRQSAIGALCASSCHTYAISSLIHSRSPHRLKTAAMLGMQMAFPAPVLPDEELAMYETYLDKRTSISRPGFGIVTSLTCIRNSSGDDVLTMKSSFLVERSGDDP
ncbi:MAG: acyl dehydratase [bacterium]|nr:acyl dehydratase [bacterium]